MACSPDSGIFSFDDPFLTEADPVLAGLDLFGTPAAMVSYRDDDSGDDVVENDPQFLVEEVEEEVGKGVEDRVESATDAIVVDDMTVVEVEEDQGMIELSSVNANANIDVLDDYEDHDDNEDNEDQDDDEGEDDDAPELIDCVSPTNLTTRQPNFQIHSYSSRSGGSSRTRRRATPLLPNSATALTRSNKSSRPRISRKRKLYELDAPLANPAAEKCRLNAINAKKNRERKKQELAVAETTIARLRTENEALREEAESARDELDEAREEIEAMRAQLKQAGLPVLGKRLRFQ